MIGTETRQHPAPGLRLATVDFGNDYDGKGSTLTDSLDEANVCTSLVAEDLTWLYGDQPRHRPVLDIDIPATLVPSSTPGHSHLYLDVELSWPAYQKLLDALAEVEIIEPGYAKASKARGFSAVRLPWVRKPSSADQETPDA